MVLQGSKRSYESADEATRQRSRRARYAQQACANCKRRKLKCSGPLICARCSERGESCTFDKDLKGTDQVSDLDTNTRFEFVDQRIVQLQKQIDQLSKNVASCLSNPNQSSTSSTRSEAEFITTKPFQEETAHREASPAYIGPTSAEFGLHDVLSAIIPSDRVGHEDDSDSIPGDATLSKSSPKKTNIEDQTLLDLNRILDLIDAYDDSVGILYPFLDVSALKAFATKAFRNHVLRDSMLLKASNSATTLAWSVQRDIEVVKLVIATALVAEDDSSRLGLRLVDSVEHTIALRIKIVQVDLKEVMIFIILSLFSFSVGNEVLAWRYIGLTARGCLEMGLHRRKTWDETSENFPGEIDRSWALKMWWSIYVLDRRWSFATGLPLALRDADIDGDLPLPEPLSPYLDCMIKYARIGEQVLDMVGNQAGRKHQASPNDRAMFSFRCQKWLANVPTELQYDRDSPVPSTPHELRQYELRLFLFLNAQHLQISIYRDVLLTSTSIENNFSEASDVITVAKSIIQVLRELDQQSNIYKKRPKLYNTFLLSALATLFLAICHKSSTFGEVCRQEFYAAIDMLKSNDSSKFMSLRTRKLVQAIHRVSSKVYPSRATTAVSNSAREGIPEQDKRKCKSKSPLPSRSVVTQRPTLSPPFFEQFSGQPDPPALNSEGHPQVAFSDLTDFLESIGGTVLSTPTRDHNHSNRIDSFSAIQGNDTASNDTDTVSDQQQIDTGSLNQSGDMTNPGWLNTIDLNIWKDDEYMTQLMADLL